jgi:hypothetical protein
VPSSLIGQPPSAQDVDCDVDFGANNLDFDVGLELQKLCEGYDLEPDLFPHEAIDDKAALLMEGEPLCLSLSRILIENSFMQFQI